MKLCYKCNKRPAVVFISDTANQSAAPQGLCLVCAKNAGIKPIDDMLKKMNISDEDIEQMSDQFMDIMALNEESDDDSFALGTAPAFPFLNNIFGSGVPMDSEDKEKDEKSDEKKEKDKQKKKKRRFIDMYCTNLTEKARDGMLDAVYQQDPNG